MATHRFYKTTPLSVQATELALAVPQVIAHRMARLAISGPLPSARDRKEFDLMSAEKVEAFSESLNAMVEQACHAHGQLAASTISSIWFPWAPAARQAASTAPVNYVTALSQILDKGMAPVHRRATANAKRLSRTRLK